MTAIRIVKTAINIALAATTALILLLCAPWSAAWPGLAAYCVLLAVFWLLLPLSLLTRQLQKTSGLTYKSYLGPDNEVKKKLVRPTAGNLKAAAARLFKPRYLAGGLALMLLFAVNHWLLFYPAQVAAYLPLLFGYDAAGGLNLLNVWLLACTLSVLLLALTVMAQTYQIRANNRLFNVQNLIVNAHSHLTLDGLYIRFVDGEKMFLAANKLEYVLQAKPLPAIQLQHGQALLQLTLKLKLERDFPVTEYSVRQLSLFVEDVVLECADGSGKFYPLFAENHQYTLNFYIRCQDVSALALSQKLAAAGAIRLFYSLSIKNSFSVITALSGSATFQKSALVNVYGNYYQPVEAKDNCYYYM